MRKSRLKLEGTGYYHCMSRTIEKRFIMGEREKEYFVELMRNLAQFSGLRILTYSIMSNHFHILLQCPQREDVSDRLLLERLRAIYPAKKVAVKAVLAQGGSLSREQLLRCRVRYFSDGVAIGSRAFVEDIFQSSRNWFGSRRQTGARAIRNAKDIGLVSMRDLQLSPISIR